MENEKTFSGEERMIFHTGQQAWGQKQTGSFDFRIYVCWFPPVDALSCSFVSLFSFAKDASLFNLMWFVICSHKLIELSPFNENLFVRLIAPKGEGTNRADVTIDLVWFVWKFEGNGTLNDWVSLSKKEGRNIFQKRN